MGLTKDDLYNVRYPKIAGEFTYIIKHCGNEMHGHSKKIPNRTEFEAK